VDVAWTSGDVSVTLRTRTEIPRGDELTICYTDAHAPMDARRKALEHAYGFECGCPRCVEESS
jgi:SET and MYND domain-containing protein